MSSDVTAPPPSTSGNDTSYSPSSEMEVTAVDVAERPESGNQRRGRAARLSRLLELNTAVCSIGHDGLSKFFPEADMAKVATKCWKQVQPQIRKETNDKHSQVFSELQLLEKLTKLDQLQEEEHGVSHSAWRPSYVPRVDHAVFETAAAAEALPDLLRQYEEAQHQSGELQQLLVQRQTELLESEQTTRDSLARLSESGRRWTAA